MKVTQEAIENAIFDFIKANDGKEPGLIELNPEDYEKLLTVNPKASSVAIQKFEVNKDSTSKFVYQRELKMIPNPALKSSEIKVS